RLLPGVPRGSRRPSKGAAPLPPVGVDPGGGTDRPAPQAGRTGHPRRGPGKLLAYNCPPSFNWERHLDARTIRRFQDDLGTMGYVFQFVTLAGFHALNASMFELARDYRQAGMSGYVRLQDREFELETEGYTATRHQAEVGTGYFDRRSRDTGGTGGTLALPGSTEAAQFEAEAATATRSLA